MSTNYLDIENIPTGFEKKVKQDLKFKTGRFLWKVKFNIPLDPKTVNSINLYVTTTNQSPLKAFIRYNPINNIIEIEPLEAYTPNESYILHITTKVTSKGGKPLKTPVQIQFKL